MWTADRDDHGVLLEIAAWCLALPAAQAAGAVTRYATIAIDTAALSV